MRRGYVVLMRWMVPGRALNLNSTNYPDHGHHGDPPLSTKNSHGRSGNRPRDLRLSSQKRWPLDHEAGLFRWSKINQIRPIFLSGDLSAAAMCTSLDTVPIWHSEGTTSSPNMALCGHRPVASPNSQSAITQFPSNYIFSLIKCGRLLIAILSMCCTAGSSELEVLLRPALALIHRYLSSRPAVLETEPAKHTAGSNCVRTYSSNARMAGGFG
jgi:hypothetical protein